MTIDDPILLAEVTAAFMEYERALMADDVPAMDGLFHDAAAQAGEGGDHRLWRQLRYR